MGLFALWYWSQGSWVPEPTDAEPWLSIDVYDSDVAVVTYAPAAGQGLFFLGKEPRAYFEDDSANEPVDRQTQSEMFAAWVESATGKAVSPPAIAALMAEEGEAEAMDVFAEETVERLLTLVGLPSPPYPE